MAETLVPDGTNLEDYLSSARRQGEERLRRNGNIRLQSRLAIDGRMFFRV